MSDLVQGAMPVDEKLQGNLYAEDAVITGNISVGADNAVLAGSLSLGTTTNTILTEVTLLASAWEGETSPYSQVVTIRGVSSNSKVDLQPSIVIRT